MQDREKTYSLSANGTAGPYQCVGGPCVVQTVGTFGSGTLAIKMDHGSGATTQYSMTAEETRVFDFPPNAEITFVLSGSSSPSLAIEVR